MERNFNNININKRLIEEINKIAKNKINIMEVCGTHTRSIHKYGINKVLNSNINFISGPGCPICVTTEGFIDNAIEACNIENTIILTFGDMIRVPGRESTLLREREKGRDIRVITSPMQCVDIAKNNNSKKIIFIAVGFETTIPTIAMMIKKASLQNIKNLFMLYELKTMPGVIKSILDDDEVKIDGLLAPGHVATIIGEEDFNNIYKQYEKGVVISGFNCTEILSSILSLVQMKENKHYEFKNLYKSVIRKNGNEIAKDVIDEVFVSCDGNWRGIGKICGTAYKLREKYREFDAYKYFNLKDNNDFKNTGCICGDVLKGKKRPYDCMLFNNTCKKESPKGPCMVSFEGACAIMLEYK